MMDAPKRVNLGYSLKNIPLPSAKEYKKVLIEKIESVVRRMRWKAHFFLKGEHEDGTDRAERFGFKSRTCPPQVPELKKFEDELYDIVNTVSFRPTSNPLQRKMTEDLKSVRESNEVVVPADKTRNLYKVSTDQYKKLLHDNVTKTYQLAPDGAYDAINHEAAAIAHGLNLDDRIDIMAKSDAFITLKDHKENFHSNQPCRLINPAKSELGVVSKTILDRVTTNLRSHVNLWKNTASVIEWFDKIPRKSDCSFLIFDIVEFYPSITRDLLQSALTFAQQYTAIKPSEIDIIMHARKSLLFENGRAWQKKEKDGTFDVTMGSFDGAEACELVGAYILSKLAPFFNQGDVGLYRDDGLAILRNASGHTADKTRKDITELFKSFGLRITISINHAIVDFLDTTFDLSSGTYRPYRKPNDTPLYVSTQSNHPPGILKNIPKGISKRISSVSCNEEVFKEAIPIYEDALAASGYPREMVFDKRTAKKKRRKRKIIWFNPPFSQNVKTKIAAKFLRLVQQHFPAGSKLSKVFNKNTIKVSYSCMPNMATRLKSHNQRLLGPPRLVKPCNCRDKANCPIPGRCQTEEVIYEARVTVSGEMKRYTGMSAPAVKARIANHNTSFRNERYSASTELSKHVWHAKNSSKPYSIEWSIKDRARSYSNTSKRCNLCTTEKYHILLSSGPDSLNRRSELVSKCRHQNKYIIGNFAGSSGVT